MKEIRLTYYDTDLGIPNYLMLYFRMIGVFVHERILSDEYGFEKYQMSERAVDADIIIWHSEFSGFNPKRVTAPVKEYEINGNTADEQWDLYTKWITATINRSTCILELGVSLAQPNLIRWPFEKMASLNYKSEFIRVNKKLPFCQKI